MLVTASGVLNRLALSNDGAGPNKASREAIWVGTTFVDEDLGRRAGRTTGLFLSLDTLTIEAGVESTLDAVITVGRSVAATGEGRVVTLVTRRAAVGGAGVVVLTVEVGQTAARHIQGVTITRVGVTYLVGTGVTVACAIRVDLTTARELLVLACLSAHIAEVRRALVEVVTCVRIGVAVVRIFDEQAGRRRRIEVTQVRGRRVSVVTLIG